MEYAALIILLALIQFFYFTGRVGLTRDKYKINAPACRGDATWERLFRVQQNTMEQLIIMIPASLLFAHYLSGPWVLLPGIVFIAGRFLYSAEYIKDPKTRGPGMGTTGVANIALVLGALFGVVRALI